MNRLTVDYADLQVVVGDALAPSTLRQIVRKHPAMYLDGGMLHVDLPKDAL